MSKERKARQAVRIAIIQSNYIPWKGYLDLIGRADHFVIYDEVQYTKNDWRNRNRIKTAHGTTWLTIPVQHSGHFGQHIDEVVMAPRDWRAKHWRTISQAYSRAPHFQTYAEEIGQTYQDESSSNLSLTNERFLKLLCHFLGITTDFHRSTEFGRADEDRVERLVQICLQLGGDTYLSGPAAKTYLDEQKFHENGIAVEYMDYTGYPEYPQLTLPFEHNVSVIDLLFNVGPDAPNYLTFADHTR